MAKPGSVQPVDVKKLEQENESLKSKVTAQGRSNSELRKKIHDESKLGERVTELQALVEELEPQVETLTEQKEQLTKWVTEFRAKKMEELEAAFRDRREELQSEIAKLEETRADEQAAIQGIVAAQEENDRRTKRIMEDAVAARNELEGRRAVARTETERMHQASVRLGETRRALNRRAEKLDEREKNLEVREASVIDVVNEAEHAKRSAEARKREFMDRGQELQADLLRVQEQRSKLDAERHAARNELARLKAEALQVEEKYKATRANLATLERRENVVAMKERALERRGIKLGD